MPIIDKMNQNNTPDDDSSEWKPPKQEPKKERPRPVPRFVDARAGRRQISLSALVERISDQFYAENTPDDSAVRAAATRSDRIKLLLPVVDYVLGVESVVLDDDGRGDVIRLAYSDIFGFGPLDVLIEDEAVTTIMLEGVSKLSVRRGHGELEPIDLIFEDESQLKEIVGRLLQRSGAILREDLPVIEIGCKADNERFLSISLVAPPAAIDLSLDIRLHPPKAPTLTDYIERGALTPKAAKILAALMASEHGFVLVGQPESGKTMFLSALLGLLPNPKGAVAVERTGELHLPEGMRREVAVWPQNPVDDPVTFGDQIQAESEKDMLVVVLDEVRADEPHTIAPLLTMAQPPRMIWSFRGAPNSKRLLSALGMLARRADVAQGETLAHNLFERLPFVVSLRRLDDRLELREIGEWYYPERAESPSYRTLIENVMGEMDVTGEVPSHALPGLDADFWQAGG